MTRVKFSLVMNAIFDHVEIGTLHASLLPQPIQQIVYLRGIKLPSRTSKEEDKLNTRPSIRSAKMLPSSEKAIAATKADVFLAQEYRVIVIHPIISENEATIARPVGRSR